MKKHKVCLFEIDKDQAELYLYNIVENASKTARRLVNDMTLQARWDFCARCIEAWIQSEALTAIAKKNRDNKSIRTMNKELSEFVRNTLRSCGVTITIHSN